MDNITVLLRAWGGGDEIAGEQVYSLIYNELRTMARRHAVGADGNTLQPTALVNEAFVRMMGAEAKTDWRDRSQFFAFTAVVMRRVILDYSRFRKAAKRDGGRVVPFDETLHDLAVHGVDIELLDEALTRLAAVDERQAKIVELRFFGGMSVDETASYLNVSPRTVNREWGLAKAWLASALNPSACD